MASSVSFASATMPIRASVSLLISSASSAAWIKVTSEEKLCGPGRDRPCVLDRGEKRVLGREPVVDRGDRAARAGREVAADAVDRGDAAEHPAAPVEVDDARQLPVAGSVDAYRHTRNLDVLDRRNRVGLAEETGGPVVESLPPLHGR